MLTRARIPFITIGALGRYLQPTICVTATRKEVDVGCRTAIIRADDMNAVCGQASEKF